MWHEIIRNIIYELGVELINFTCIKYENFYVKYAKFQDWQKSQLYVKIKIC